MFTSHHEARNNSSRVINSKLQKNSVFTGVGKNSQNPKPVESPLAGKNTPLPAALVRAFPEWPNLKTQLWKWAPAFLRKNKLVLWDEPSAVVEDSICICFTIHHHALQNQIPKILTQRNSLPNLNNCSKYSKYNEPKILLSSLYQRSQIGLNCPVAHVKQAQLLCLGWQ